MKKRLNENGDVVYAVEEDDIVEGIGDDGQHTRGIRIPVEFIPLWIYKLDDDARAEALAKVQWLPRADGDGWEVYFPSESDGDPDGEPPVWET